jgi:hypothetical protein
MITLEITKAEAVLIDRALAMQEWMDRTAAPEQAEAAEQRKSVTFPLRMKLFQAINQERERNG